MKRSQYILITAFFINAIIYCLFIKMVFAVTQEPTQPEKSGQPETSEVIKRAKVEYGAQDLKDPFQEPSEEEPVQIEEQEKTATEEEKQVEPPPPLTIQGLIWGGNFPQAIINNTVVKIGDTIDGAQVTNINKDGVTVLFSGQEHNLSSPSASIASDYKKSKGGQDETSP